ncbi:transposase [Streptomyces sp. NBC_00647]|uniref:transposase n=1 Tax=Streptomyces sp. NBC_00647 TaxID=2975796 RepID=UPI00324DF5D8
MPWEARQQRRTLPDWRLFAEPFFSEIVRAIGRKSNRSRRYTEEFKRHAVALVHSSRKTVTEVARELGVSAEGLRNWVKQDTVDRGQGMP